MVINDFAPWPVLGDEIEERMRVLEIDAAVRERWAAQHKQQYDGIVRWCERFGQLKRMEWRGDGSLHVHWKEREVADTVSALSEMVGVECTLISCY